VSAEKRLGVAENPENRVSLAAGRCARFTHPVAAGHDALCKSPRLFAAFSNAKAFVNQPSAAHILLSKYRFVCFLYGFL
jgi:hypothetical protein